MCTKHSVSITEDKVWGLGGGMLVSVVWFGFVYPGHRMIKDEAVMSSIRKYTKFHLVK